MRVTIDRVEASVRAVEDPELPHVTLGDLGIVRSVDLEGGVVRVVLTPTFVGCPALEQIKDDVGEAIEILGLEPRIETTLSPPWSSDWITEEGREKLRRAGIAPPPRLGDQEPLVALDRPVRCPRCGAVAERLSEFGATACKAPYRCTTCSEPFEGFKPL
ncbi:MAG: 1,2-phenylacetyl-CoA epoxidase subunit PaaD [Acidobacteriota bacterium]